jgi:hypothetical protein
MQQPYPYTLHHGGTHGTKEFLFEPDASRMLQ